MRDRFEVVVLGKHMELRNFNNTVKPFNLVVFYQICTPFSLSLLYYLSVSYGNLMEEKKYFLSKIKYLLYIYYVGLGCWELGNSQLILA